jgi:hypothetical protein
MEVAIPIKDVGWVRLIPADSQHGFQIATDIDFSAFVDSSLMIGRTRTLPNGVSFPSYVTTDLYSVELKRDQNMNTKLYLGTTGEKRYVGVGLELKFVDSRFPEGLAISQNLQDGAKRNVGVVSFYGPKMSNGKIVAPGGIFIASDINGLRGQSAAQGFTVSTAGTEMNPVSLLPYDGFDVVGKNGEYLGGIIAPGINLSLKALHDMTAQLPKISIKAQKNVIGKSTVEAMNSGVYHGYIAMVEGLINKIENELQTKTTRIITGGLAEIFKEPLIDSNIIHYHQPDLTLEGLKMIFERN